MARAKNKQIPSQQAFPEHARQVFVGQMFDIFQWEQELFDGTTAVFEKIARADSVGILAITSDNQVVVTHQEQPGMPPFTSLVGGVIDVGEEPLISAQRELLEETGMVATSWELWFVTQPSSRMDWTLHQYVARGCIKVQEQQLDGGEKIMVTTHEWNSFLKHMMQDEFRDTEVALRICKLLIKHGQQLTWQKILQSDGGLGHPVVG